MRGWRKTALGVLLIFTLAIIGCSSTTETKKEVLKVGTEAAYAPFEYQDEQGKINGFDAELIQALADQMGMELDLQHFPWDSHDDIVNNGTVDAVISSVTITEERKQKMDFSDPYFESFQSIAIRNGSTIKGKNDLVGKVVGVQADTTGQTAAEAIKGVKEVRKFPGTIDALKSLGKGQIDAVVADFPVASNYIKNNPAAGLVLVNDNFEKEYYGIKIKKGNAKLLSKINEALAQVKKSGSYDEIYQRYFGQ